MKNKCAGLSQMFVHYRSFTDVIMNVCSCECAFECLTVCKVCNLHNNLQWFTLVYDNRFRNTYLVPVTKISSDSMRITAHCLVYIYRKLLLIWDELSAFDDELSKCNASKLHPVYCKTCLLFLNYIWFTVKYIQSRRHIHAYCAPWSNDSHAVHNKL